MIIRNYYIFVLNGTLVEIMFDKTVFKLLRQNSIIFIIALLCLVMNGCSPDLIDDISTFQALPVALDLAQNEDVSALFGDYYDQYQEEIDRLVEYRARYEAEFNLDRRVAEHPYRIAETYMRAYQPGPSPRIFQTTYIRDRNGELIAELFEGGRRTWVRLEDISPYLRNAIIATEDATFYTNSGVDLLRILGALRQNLSSEEIRSGASTITMQLSRNLFLGLNERYAQSFERKAMEYYLAQDLTRLYTKDELLEIYLNLIYFGHGAYGAEAAAKIYFSKSAVELTPSEATLLAGLPQLPFELNPYNNFKRSRIRQRTVLNLMVRHERISAKEADDIYQQPIELNSDPQIAPEPNLAPHFVQYMARYFQAAGYGRLSRAGLTIQSTLDLRLQEIAELVVAERVRNYLYQKYSISNASLVAMEPGTANILAMVGSVDFNDNYISGQFNSALGLRQPGSAIKPILYASAFNLNKISPSTVLWDTPVNYEWQQGYYYSPTNYDDKYHGPVTARQALANSYNVPMVKLLHGLGIGEMLQTARRMGIQSLGEDEEFYGLSLSLGGGEVTLLDLTTAYHTMANGGYYIPATPYTIMGSAESDHIQPERNKELQAVSPEAAFLVTDILSDNEARAPVFGTSSWLNLNVPAAAKTGTTTDWRDNWTIGYTRYLVVGVWSGNTDGRPTLESTGMRGAAPIWGDFMKAVLDEPELLSSLGALPPEQYPEAWKFQPPSSIIRMGCPNSIYCPEGGEAFSQAWLSKYAEYGPYSESLEYKPVRYALYNFDGTAYSTSTYPVYCIDEKSGTVMSDDYTILKLPDATTALNEWSKYLASRSAYAPPPLPRGDKLQPNLAGRRVRISDALFEPVDTNTNVSFLYADDNELNRFRNLAWGIRGSIPVSLGRCDELLFHNTRINETWDSLAPRFGLTVDELRAANPHLGDLREGTLILVPDGLAVTLYIDSPTYAVQPGDHWRSIARKLQMPLRVLQAFNSNLLRDGDLLRPGEKLVIPEIEAN